MRETRPRLGVARASQEEAGPPRPNSLKFAALHAEQLNPRPNPTIETAYRLARSRNSAQLRLCVSVWSVPNENRFFLH